ncbi:hypothetical protein GBA65_18335 [Rubrobacter marinus]|uniref:Uncharacterized protein n=1 Tax=Rubrobacter marinus TaxID=2653852 RepID=A0A6G8Q105_9ACTN|nr:hypothetical protein [Rubrobacter marinus]QIN80152.1 hypothetical protein GBA65_18335 [Rubrobacter marinus]
MRAEPGPEEAAAIAAALEVLRRERPEVRLPKRDRWRLAGLLGHAPPREMKLAGSLWSYSSWEGMV